MPITPSLDAKIRHWRIRRNVFFALYYRAVKPVPKPDAVWASLMELDNVLNDCADAGLIERQWQPNPPPPTADDNGGFSDDYLLEHLGRQPVETK